MPRVARVCAGTAGVLALAGLLGWVLDSELLTRIVPRFASTKETSALGLFLLALAWFVPRRVGVALSVIVGVLATWMLTGVVFDAPLGLQVIDFSSASDDSTNMPSIASAVALLVLSAAALFFYLGQVERAQSAALFALLCATIALLGYAYDVDSLYATRPFTTVALHAALAVGLLALALLASVENGGMVWAVHGSDPGALLVRRLLPLALLGLPVLGFGCLLPCSRIGIGLLLICTTS